MRKPRFIFAYGAAGLAFVSAHTTESTLRLGIVMVLFGEVIRFWANGHIGHLKVNQCGGNKNSKIGQLITAGPYAFVRNPLYLGSFLIGIGFSTIVGNVWLGLTAAALFFILYLRQIKEEEGVLRHEWEDTYLDYYAAVPRWVPTWRRYPYRSGSWNWRGIVTSKEWETGIWAIVLLILFYFREEFFQEHELFAAKKWEKHTILFGIAVLLIASDGILKLTQRLIRQDPHQSLRRSPWIFRQRKYLPVPLVILGVWAVVQQGHPFRPGSLPRKALDFLAWVLILCGETLRIWGVGHIGRRSRSSHLQASRLVTSGPYTYTRNPLYLGGFLLTFGLSLLTGSVWIAAGCLLYWVLVYGPIVRAEERFLKQTFGPAYEDYCRAVLRWWPRLRPAQDVRRARWRWGELNKEYLSVTSILVTVFLIHVSLVGSEWLHKGPLPQPLARSAKTNAVQTNRPPQEPPIALPPISSNVAYRIQIRGVSLTDLMSASNTRKGMSAITDRHWHGEAAGIVAGFSTFVAMAMLHEIDDLHDEERFNVTFVDLLLAATVGDSTRHIVSYQTQRSFPESVSSFSPQETSSRCWNLFVDPREREVGIAITYQF